MGLLDKFKKTASDMKDKAEDLADEHGGKVKEGLDKAGEFVDEKTGRKHSDKIDDAIDKAQDAVDDLADDADDADEGGS